MITAKNIYNTFSIHYSAPTTPVDVFRSMFDESLEFSDAWNEYKTHGISEMEQTFNICIFHAASHANYLIAYINCNIFNNKQNRRL